MDDIFQFFLNVLFFLSYVIIFAPCDQKTVDTIPKHCPAGLHSWSSVMTVEKAFSKVFSKAKDFTIVVSC